MLTSGSSVCVHCTSSCPLELGVIRLRAIQGDVDLAAFADLEFDGITHHRYRRHVDDGDVDADHVRVELAIVNLQLSDRRPWRAAMRFAMAVEADSTGGGRMPSG